MRTKRRHESIQEAAERHGVNHQQIRRAIKANKIPIGVWARLNGRYYINSERFDRFMDNGGTAQATG